MIDRQCAGILPDKPHTVLRAPDGSLLYEEMLTRHGFEGPYGYFYHRFPVPRHVEAAACNRGWTPPRPDAAGPGILARHLYDSARVPQGGMLVDRRTPILFNEDVVILLARPDATDDAYFANGDGDELWFVYEGAGKLESPCGWLPIAAGDYVWIPRAMIHRWHVDEPMRLFGIEAHGGAGVPRSYRNEIGQLRIDAPYTHRDFRRPAGPIARMDVDVDGPRELLVRRHGTTTRYALAHPAMDVVGWDGFVYPTALPIERFSPKTGALHLPPTAHATFEGRGFVVCSFVPRLLDYHPRAIPCPYPHSSVDCDEVIFYVRGEFTSRRGVGPGAISLHPSGIAHGPHPGAYEASIGARRTDEVAVMCDTFAPLTATAQATNVEVSGYNDSWRVG